MYVQCALFDVVASIIKFQRNFGACMEAYACIRTMNKKPVVNIHFAALMLYFFEFIPSYFCRVALLSSSMRWLISSNIVERKFQLCEQKY